MWIYMILFLCLFESGLTFPRFESKNQDIYEIQEDKASNTVRFVNPKPEKPVLREITYYHVIEKAYNGQTGNGQLATSVNVTNDSEENSEEASEENELETERPFTNGHGFEFIDILPVLIESDKLMQNNSTNLEEFSDEDMGNEDVYDDDNVETLLPLETSENITKEPITFGEEIKSHNDSVKEVKAVVSPSSESLMKEERSSQNITEDVPFKENVSTTIVLEATTEKTTKKSTKSHELFESPEKLKERFLKMKNLFPSVRVKDPTANDKTQKISSRHRRFAIQEIPEAPTLAPLNYDILPAYIRKTLSTEKPLPGKTETNRRKPHHDSKMHDKHREVVKKRMEDIFSKIEKDSDDDHADFDINQDGIVNLITNKVRTFGMNLTSDNGFVWNNLWSNPGTSYNVGELETVTETAVVETTNKGEEQPNSDKNSKEVSNISQEQASSEDDNSTPDNITPSNNESSNEDLQDIFVNIDKDKQKEHVIEKVTEPENHTNGSSLQDHEDLDLDGVIELADSDEDDEEDIDNDGTPETLKDLMENEKFWDWLADWTSTYMDLLSEYIRKIVKEEVLKQNLHKDNCDKSVGRKPESIQLIQEKKSPEMEDKKDSKDTKTTNSEKPESIDTVQEKKSTEMDSNTDTKDTNTTDSISQNNLENHEKKTIFVDGKEIPLTTTSNIKMVKEDEDMLRPRKHHDKKKNQPTSSNNKTDIMPKKNITESDIKVNSQNIYGNSLGNNKVTNVFIFFPDKSTQDIIKGLQPLLTDGNSNKSNKISNVTFDNRINVPDNLNNTENKSEINITTTDNPQPSSVVTDKSKLNFTEGEKTNNTELVTKTEAINTNPTLSTVTETTTKAIDLKDVSTTEGLLKPDENESLNNTEEVNKLDTSTDSETDKIENTTKITTVSESSTVIDQSTTESSESSNTTNKSDIEDKKDEETGTQNPIK